MQARGTQEVSHADERSWASAAFRPSPGTQLGLGRRLLVAFPRTPKGIMTWFLEPPIVWVLLALTESAVFWTPRTTVEPLTPARKRGHDDERQSDDPYQDPKLHGQSRLALRDLAIESRAADAPQPSAHAAVCALIYR